MKLLTFDEKLYTHYTKHCMAQLAAEGLSVDWTSPEHLTDDEAVTVLISGRFKKAYLEKLPNLKAVIVPYTGLNGLDMATLEAKGIRVMNTSAHGKFVAERALALLLALRGKLVMVHNSLAKQDWSNRYGDDRISWKSVQGSKVAIYGYGTIGRALGAFLKPLGAEIGVVAYKDRDFSPAKSFDSLKALCAWCDTLVVAAPLTEETRDSVDEAVLSVMTGKAIVNVGRGKIIHEKALYDSLKEGRLWGFAADVWYNYPKGEGDDCFPSVYPFHELSNVVMTPHNGGFEEGARKVRYEDVLAQIVAFKNEILKEEGTLDGA